MTDQKESLMREENTEVFDLRGCKTEFTEKKDLLNAVLSNLWPKEAKIKVWIYNDIWKGFVCNFQPIDLPAHHSLNRIVLKINDGDQELICDKYQSALFFCNKRIQELETSLTLDTDSIVSHSPIWKLNSLNKRLTSSLNDYIDDSEEWFTWSCSLRDDLDETWAISKVTEIINKMLYYKNLKKRLSSMIWTDQSN